MKPSEFPGELILQRGKYGLTQKGLADKLNVSARSVMTWESGKTMPHKAMRIQLAHVFDLKPTYFLDEGEIPGIQAPKNEKDELAYLHSSLENALAKADVSDELKKSMARILKDATQNLYARSEEKPISE